MVQKPCDPIRDAIGQPLEIDDYVTAVFSEGEVELFQVVGFVFHTQKWMSNHEPMAKLVLRPINKRHRSNTPYFYRKSEAITKVSKDAVLLHTLEQ
jgi:hypothetical protein